MLSLTNAEISKLAERKKKKAEIRKLRTRHPVDEVMYARSLLPRIAQRLRGIVI